MLQVQDPRLYVIGNSYLNGTINVINTSRFWNYIDINYSLSGGSHRLTSQASNPAQLYNHYFQEEHGTVAHKTDVIIGNYSSGQDCSTTFEALFHSGISLRKLDAWCEMDVGTTVTIIVQDALSSASLCILVCAGTGALHLTQVLQSQIYQVQKHYSKLMPPEQ